MPRPLPLTLFAVLLACASRPPAKESDAVARTQAIERQFIADALEQGFAFAANLQPPGLRYDKLPDVSLPAIAARDARLDLWRDELGAINPAKLQGTPAYLARELMLMSLEGNAAARACHFELWVTSPTFGWQAFLVEALRSQPVDTDERRAQALARISVQAPRFIAQQTDDRREGMRRGYLPAKAALRAVLDQLDGLLLKPGRDSALASPGLRAGVPVFKDEVERVVDQKLLPALRAHRDFLRNEVLPASRDKEGVSNLPDGESCYRGALKEFDNLDLDPRQLHQTGLQQIEATEASMRTLSEKHFGGAPLPQLMKTFRTAPQYLFKSREEILEQAGAAVDRGWAALPRAFTRLPAKKVVIEPYPAFLEKTSPPRYYPASLDGKKPARYLIRLYEAEKQTRVGGEDIAFHETIPGHHLQIALVQETAGLPPVANHIFNGAFGEGWALYAEGLADELGLYSDDAQRIGMLSSRNWRAARIVVDTGIHVLSWDRQRAIDYLLQHAALSADFAAAEVDRYISMPGQATSYMVGYLEITRLRRKAEQELGAKFDLKAFHDRVLEQGSIALPSMAVHVEEWIARARHGH